jgi:hypothetical protein
MRWKIILLSMTIVIGVQFHVCTLSFEIICGDKSACNMWFLYLQYLCAMPMQFVY